MFTTLIWLTFMHFLADYPLQGQFLSDAKNHKKPIPGVPWFLCLVSHAAIQAGFVFVVVTLSVLTQVYLLTNLYNADILYFALAVAMLCCLFELLAHTIIDFLKCHGSINYWTDQGLHLTCKLFYAAWISILLTPGVM